MKDLVSETVWLEILIFSKASRVGFTVSLLTCSRLLASSPLACACALAAIRNAPAMKSAIAQTEDANRNLRPTIVPLPPSLDSLERASEKVKAALRYNQTTILAVRCHRHNLATTLLANLRAGAARSLA